MFCESCGSFIPDNQSVCPNCGAQAFQPEQPAVSQSQVQPETQPVYQQPIYQQPAPQPAYQQTNQPVYTQPAPVAATPAKRSNGLAVAGLIFGIASLVLCWVPFLGIILSIIGLGLSIAGIAKKNASGKGMGIAGLIMSIVAGIIGIFLTLILSVGISTYLERAEEAAASVQAHNESIQEVQDGIDFNINLDPDI